jgi:hypothetical protein
MNKYEQARKQALTLDMAIEWLESLRREHGGKTPLLMADGLPVVEFQEAEDGSAVTVCDRGWEDVYAWHESAHMFEEC